MADLGSTSENTVGVVIKTIADNGAIEQTIAELDVLDKQSAKTATSSASSFEKFNKSLKGFGTEAINAGRSLTTGISLPIAAVAGLSIKSAMSFQQAMTYVKTDAGDTTDSISKLSNQVLQLAHNSQFSPDDLANGLYHLASLGLRGADAMKALNTAQQMAAVGGADLESTATALGGALVTGISGVQNYTQAAGVLDATVGAGNMRMQDLVSAIGTGVLPVFKNAGLTITDFGAALATLTDNGQQADAAATHLRMTVSLMEAPSKAAQGALAGIGISANQLGLDMQTKGLIPALEDLKQHLLDTYGTTAEGKEKIAQTLTQAFGGGRSSAAIQTLIDQLGRVQMKETQIGQQSGEFATKYAEQQQTAAAQFKTAWDSVQASMIQLGTAIMPDVAHVLTDVAHAVADVTNWFNNLAPGQKQFIIDMAGVAAAVGPTILVFGRLAKSLSEIFTLTRTVGGALGLLSDTKGVAGGVGILGRLLGGAGGAEAGIAGVEGATEAVGGLAAAFPPLAVAIGAAVVVGGGAYLLWKHLGDEAKNQEGYLHQQVAGWNQWATTMNFVKGGLQDVKGASEQLSKVEHQQIADQKQLKLATIDSNNTTKQYNKAVEQLNKDLANNHTPASKVQADQERVNNLAAISAQKLNTVARWQTTVNNDTTAYHRALGEAQSAQEEYNRLLGITNKGLGSMVDKVATLIKHPVVGVKLNVGANISGITLMGRAMPTNTALNLMDAMTGSTGTGGFAQSGAVMNMQLSGGGLQGGGLPGHALGSNYTRGGWSMVGENGPEAVYLPQGATVKNNNQTNNSTSNSSSVTIGTVVLNTASAVTQFLTQLDLDNMIASKGMTASRGLR